MAIVYIGVGSNLGEKIENCEKAIAHLQSRTNVKNIIKSKWYNTKGLEYSGNSQNKRRTLIEEKRPTLMEEVPDYINGVIKIETDLEPLALLHGLQEIESKLGRVRTGKKWESRTIDLDILFYGDKIIDLPDLKIPHPELHKRLFVLDPLCDMAPLLIHPVLKKDIKHLREEILNSNIFSQRLIRP